ncbi:acyl-CoA dehydrogenase family protein [Rhodoferax sp. PAMC 29310]|uniref:acyl-CoA dehydrogenase family protein n=1 Tax=Rhodoferax sp. PAMC 29310 TaxID=2822760 RepID=UPI001B31C01E|nr:acyl-CoA dehydrogenase family protein [Rhodoferax sp. PAMC 29310]
MKDFLLSTQDGQFRSDARDFLQRELGPRAAAIEDREEWGEVKAVIKALGEGGYLKLMFQDLYQGSLSAPGLTHAVILSEEAAALSYAFETTIATATSCAYPLHRYAQPEVRDQYLAGIVNGSEIGAICVTEQNVGSDSAGMQTTIVFDSATNEWVINGFKRYISNASVADTYIVYGISNPDVAPQKGMSAIVVPKGTKGIRFPRTYNFMGRRGCIVGEVEFTNCRVPANHLLGQVNEGFKIMLSMFNFERVILGGSGLGVARSAFEIARRHAQQRVSFGQKLGCKQLIWNSISEMSWRIDAAELITYRAAKLYDSGHLSPKELMKPASMAKLCSTEAATFCADATVQILGGDGLTKQFGRAEQIYRDARALTIVGGTTEMVKYLIASVDLPEIKINL